MTGYDMISRVWQDCGEPTDIDPTVDSEFLITTLNRALEAVATWKGYQGRRVAMFPQYVRKVFKKNLREDTTVTVEETDDVIEVDSNPVTFTVAVGDFVEYDGEVRLIWFVDDRQYYLSSAFSSIVPAGGTVTVVQNLMTPTVPRFVEYLRLENVETKSYLPKMNKLESNIDKVESTGTPTAWKRQQAGIEFDVIPDESYLWRVWYYKLPELYTEDMYSSELDVDLPDEFHGAVMFYMQSLVFRHMQEIESGNNAFQAFDSVMKITVGSWQRENMLSGGGAMGVSAT